MRTLSKKINIRFLQPVIGLLYLGYITCIRNIIGYGFYVKLMTATMLLSLVLTVFGALRIDQEKIVIWLRSNCFLLLYFICRLISLVLTHFNRTVLLTLILETYYLITVLNSSSYGFKSKVQIITFYIFSVVYHASNWFIFRRFHRFPLDVQEWFLENTIIWRYWSAPISTNPNAGGILCSFAIVVSLILFIETKTVIKKTAALLLGVFHILCFKTLYADVRSAIFSLVGAIIILVLGLIVKKFRGRAAVIIVLCCSIMISLGVGTLFINNNQMNSLTERESMYNAISSSRYMIWKTCFLTMGNSAIFGKGSLQLDRQYRKQYIKENVNGDKELYLSAAGFTPHNGYLEVIMATGFLGFSMLIIHLLYVIKRAKRIDDGYWYITICFTLINNIFEGLFILDRFFPCLYMFRELSAEELNGKSGNLLSKE